MKGFLTVHAVPDEQEALAMVEKLWSEGIMASANACRQQHRMLTSDY